MTSLELSNALIKKYNLNSVQDVLDWIDNSLLELEQESDHDK